MISKGDLLKEVQKRKEEESMKKIHQEQKANTAHSGQKAHEVGKFEYG